MDTSKLVDYDVIIKVNTLTWVLYDCGVDFELAGHIDCDVHISLLYDVGEDTPEDYTGVRVTYPLDADERLGFITPPASPRRFVEESVTSGELESSHTYIGDISVSPVGTRTGVMQTLSLHNITGVAELGLVDSPIKNEAGQIFDATEWMEIVSDIPQIVKGSETIPSDAIFSSFDRLDYLRSLTDDVQFDYLTHSLKGTITLGYDDRRMHIKKAWVEFFHGMNPTYKLEGIGDWRNIESPLRLHIEQTYDSNHGFDLLMNMGSIRFHLLVKDMAILTGDELGYQWTHYDYGFSPANWKVERITDNIHTSPTSTHFYIGATGPNPVPLITEENIVDPVARPNCMLSAYRTSMGAMTVRDMGEVISVYVIDSVYSPAGMDMSYMQTLGQGPWLQSIIESKDALGLTLEDIVSDYDQLSIYNISNSTRLSVSLVSWIED